MKKHRKNLIVIIALLLILCINVFNSFAVYANESQESILSGEVINGTVDNLGEKESNLFGKIAWAVVTIGVIFIIYLLISLPRKRGKAYLNGVKHRRSPYNKRKKRIVQSQYYDYKRNKYK